MEITTSVLNLLLLVLMSLARETTGENASISLPESFQTRQASSKNKWFPMPHTDEMLLTTLNDSTYIITGFIPPHAAKFAVELCPESTCYPIKAFHFSVRFNAQVVVRTHRLETGWGKEQTRGGMPFTRGTNFNLRIRVTASKYQVYVNHRFFTDYTYEFPYEQVGFIKVFGSVLINRTAVLNVGKGDRVSLRRSLKDGDWIRHEVVVSKNATRYWFYISNTLLGTSVFAIEAHKGGTFQTCCTGSDGAELLSINKTFTDLNIIMETEFLSDGVVKIYDDKNFLTTIRVTNLTVLEGSRSIHTRDVTKVESFRKP
ncbi:uncharacterized protein LOC131929713 [Physella acuta]|uniref:uncharacterized protein LOC131929713 n=1 Tax=Physella acuta TaxID=109671 RepID=UPI0027DDA43B|nr:uncharacterized protein LOC131929713 [Physella acuta]